ncbi:MAG: DUF2244 domain-containing protein [Ancalomicrobiaceae bacterium]|nr:DUF2244 domain-containing protein [Ancalomicrobiaceae bacterium]
MSDDNAAAADPPVFSAMLTPHRSLPAKGFVGLVALAVGLALLTGLIFGRLGAWPIVGFCGLDVALLVAAFLVNYRAARAYEEVEVHWHEVVLRQVASNGRTREYRFNPAWVRLEIDRLDDEGIVRIAFFSHGRGVELARFLNPEDRTSFAAALKRAIGHARGRPSA